MQAQHQTHAPKRALLMLATTVTLVLTALASSAAASRSRACILMDASQAKVRTTFAVRGDCDGPQPTIIRGDTTPSAFMRLNTSGLWSLHGAVALVDATGHVVSPKGSRVGGRTVD